MARPPTVLSQARRLIRTWALGLGTWALLSVLEAAERRLITTPEGTSRAPQP